MQTMVDYVHNTVGFGLDYRLIKTTIGGKWAKQTKNTSARDGTNFQLGTIANVLLHIITISDVRTDGRTYDWSDK